MDPSVRPLADLPELFQKGLTIRVILENRCPAISAIQRMFDWTLKLPARFASHGRLPATPFLRSACPATWKAIQHREKMG